MDKFISFLESVESQNPLLVSKVKQAYLLAESYESRIGIAPKKRAAARAERQAQDTERERRAPFSDSSMQEKGFFRNDVAERSEYLLNKKDKLDPKDFKFRVLLQKFTEMNDILMRDVEQLAATMPPAKGDALIAKFQAKTDAIGKKLVELDPGIADYLIPPEE